MRTINVNTITENIKDMCIQRGAGPNSLGRQRLACSGSGTEGGQAELPGAQGGAEETAQGAQGRGGV